ncbi:hypothetical protein CXB51_001341 [Gossypium anomalum]|uniref:Uncharacterized protein n=1 Tax=Gossypium anomalum TaxID=47600 RepID=A0A8J6D9G6_9ROSI|nr:hypothetical protein CXB51_001341 [Gossypium anomalum]
MGLLGAKPVGSPIEQNHRLTHVTRAVLTDPEFYIRLMGCLDATLRVVWYLRGSPSQGILLRSDSNLSLKGWCDSDCAACLLAFAYWLTCLSGTISYFLEN